MTKKKMVEILDGMMMLQDHYFGTGELDCWGVKLVDVVRNPGVLEMVIEEGRFGPRLGAALQQLIIEPQKASRPLIDHDIRLIVSDGHGWALLSIAREGQCRMVLLTFQRGPTPFSADDKAKMFRTLDLCRPLIEKILGEAIQMAKEDAKEKAAEKAAFAKKLLSLPEPEIEEGKFRVTIGERTVRIDLLAYKMPDGEVLDAARVYNGDELVGEFPPRYCDGFHSTAMYESVNQAIEIAREILQTGIDETARVQSCRIEHDAYGQHHTIGSRVYAEGRQIVWELTINGKGERGPEVCSVDNPDGWIRLTRIAANKWREAVGEQLAKFVVHVGDDE